MQASLSPSPGPRKPLVLLVGDPRLVKPVENAINEHKLANTKTPRALNHPTPNPVIFYYAVKTENSMQSGPVFCVLHYEFNKDISDIPYFTVDSLHSSCGSHILGDTESLMLQIPGAMVFEHFRMPRAFLSPHPSLHEIINDMKRTWKDIATSTGKSDIWPRVNDLFSIYLSGKIDQSLWDFILSDLSPGPRLKRAIHSSALHGQFYDFEKALMLDISHSSESHHTLHELQAASFMEAGNRVPSYQITFSQHPYERDLIKAIVEGSLSWLNAKLDQ